MAPRIALVTGALDAVDDGLAEAAVSVDAPLEAALTERGVEHDRPRWDDPDVDWRAYDAVVVRTTWDYAGRRDDFVAWAAAVGDDQLLINTADVLRWNTHKSYLLELEERGAPVVPTAWLGQGDRVDLAALLRARSWPDAVIKPAVAAGSAGLVRVSAGADLGAAQRHLDALLAVGDVMVQPFLASVETRGELSVVVIDGQVTHAVRKTPMVGDFRIQERFGGRYTPVEVDREVDALARWIVDATGAQLVIARVDLLEADDGALQLAELEATEPDLYLSVAPHVADTLADALLGHVRVGR